MNGWCRIRLVWSRLSEFGNTAGSFARDIRHIQLVFVGDMHYKKMIKWIGYVEIGYFDMSITEFGNNVWSFTEYIREIHLTFESE